MYKLMMILMLLVSSGNLLAMENQREDAYENLDKKQDGNLKKLIKQSESDKKKMKAQSLSENRTLGNLCMDLKTFLSGSTDCLECGSCTNCGDCKNCLDCSNVVPCNPVECCILGCACLISCLPCLDILFTGHRHYN